MAIIKSSSDHLTLNADGASKDIKLQANGSEKVIIKSDGSVGVGEPTPQALLHIKGNTPVIRISDNNSTSEDDAVGRIEFYDRNSDLNGYIQAGTGSSADLIINAYNSRSIIFQNNGTTERMRIDSSGNVGIGMTSNLQHKLAFAENGSVGWQTSAGTNKADIKFETGGDTLQFSTAGSARMRIDSSGNVGIGVTPETWHSSWTGLQVGGMGTISGETAEALGNQMSASNNAYLGSGGGWLYKMTEKATQHQQADGEHVFRVASSGTADSAISWTTAMTIDNSGAVTMPNQPAFGCTLSTHQLNIAIYGERQIEFDTERFDRGGDFNTTTHTFTAPVTGLYQMNLVCNLDNEQGAANFYGYHIRTSNKTYYFYNLGGRDRNHSGGNAMSCLVDMDAGDTCDTAIYQHAGSSVSDIQSQSSFSGFLVA